MNDSKIKIMIVEDEGIIAMDIKCKLIDMGYEVTAIAQSYGEAIIKITRSRPHLILMDINLIGAINGIETAEYIKQTYDIPSLFVTAYTDYETKKSAAKVSSLGILTKPFDDSEFKKKMHKLHLN